MASEVRTPARRARPRAPRRADAGHGPAPRPRGGLFAGGTEGNERLTVLTGLLLIALLAALGITILRIGPLLWEHFFLGLLLLGPVALKLASTGYRFVRYYTHNERYRIKGPPPVILRLLAPAVVALTLLVFGSGIALLFVGPNSRWRSDAFLIHKVSFILWIGAFGIHVLGHLPEVLRLLRISGDTRRQVLAMRSAGTRGSTAAPVAPALHERLPGRGGRWLALSAGLVAGFVLAVALIPDFGVWTNNVAATLHH